MSEAIVNKVSWPTKIRNSARVVMRILEAMENGSYGYLDDRIKALEHTVSRLEEEQKADLAAKAKTDPRT